MNGGAIILLMDGMGGPEGRGRDIEINLSNNKIKDISTVKDFAHLKKLDLSNNKIEDISKLAEYNFKCWEFEGEIGEDIEDFTGIFLDGNYIDKNNTNNKKAINVFGNKKVTLKIDNQKQKEANMVFSDIKRK